jgi:regulator of protease activity HflC (stomatin/prohibitin superfamily)
MVPFIGTILILLAITIAIQLISKMKIIGGNELAIKSGQKWKPKGFSTVSGGRVFVIPLLNRFAKIDLTPHTIEVVVESAIAAGIVPLDVKATVSFAIASNEAGRSRAATRILEMTQDKEQLRKVASSIIEGHLRDAIASMTPEQVMQDKDALVARMINVCKEDLENIGIEITTMNIADVDDRRLAGVDEPDLYIALLKRIQTANAETQARVARAEATAAAAEEQEKRRADVQVRHYENMYQNLVAETRVKVAEEDQRKAIGVQKALREAEANVAGLKAEIEAEKQRIQMLEQKYEAEIITPAQAEQDRLALEAKKDAAKFLGKAQAEIEQIKQTLEILEQSGESGIQTYIIENFQRLIEPFAETLSMFPVGQVSVVTGVEGSHEPISAIHPNAIAEEKNKLIAGALASALEKKSRIKETRKKPGATGVADESIQDLMIDLRDVQEITSIKDD